MKVKRINKLVLSIWLFGSVFSTLVLPEATENFANILQQRGATVSEAVVNGVRVNLITMPSGRALKFDRMRLSGSKILPGTALVGRGEIIFTNCVLQNIQFENLSLSSGIRMAFWNCAIDNKTMGSLVRLGEKLKKDFFQKKPVGALFFGFGSVRKGKKRRAESGNGSAGGPGVNTAGQSVNQGSGHGGNAGGQTTQSQGGWQQR